MLNKLGIILRMFSQTRTAVTMHQQEPYCPRQLDLLLVTHPCGSTALLCGMKFCTPAKVMHRNNGRTTAMGDAFLRGEGTCGFSQRMRKFEMLWLKTILL
jgi:hypothetical protein